MRVIKPVFILLVTALLVTGLLSGCQTIGEREQSKILEDTLRAYSGIIRWGSLEKAYSFRDPTNEEEPDDIPEGLDNIRVTSYEVVQGPTMTSETTAVQVVMIEYLHKDRQVIRRIQDKQLWRYNEEQERWSLSTRVPQFK